MSNKINKIMINNAKVTVRSQPKTIVKENFKWNRCAYCDDLFISARKSAMYCSDNCRTKKSLEGKKTREILLALKERRWRFDENI